jgi:hypothetical protein
VAIAQKAGGDRVYVIRGDRWRKDRKMENTRHRAILLHHAQAIGAPWCLCFDADERLVGDLPALKPPNSLFTIPDGFRFRLFDGYLTKERQEPYQGGDLRDLPRMWGPEFRDIIMLFRTDKAQYVGSGRREPLMAGPFGLAPIKVKHYGKCISVEQWEETCNYYSTHFKEPFKSRWELRKGKAIHTQSDYGRPLYTWQELMDRPDVWKCRNAQARNLVKPDSKLLRKDK